MNQLFTVQALLSLAAPRPISALLPVSAARLMQLRRLLLRGLWRSLLPGPPRPPCLLQSRYRHLLCPTLSRFPHLILCLSQFPPIPAYLLLRSPHLLLCQLLHLSLHPELSSAPVPLCLLLSRSPHLPLCLLLSQLLHLLPHFSLHLLPDTTVSLVALPASAQGKCTAIAK